MDLFRDEIASNLGDMEGERLTALVVAGGMVAMGLALTILFWVSQPDLNGRVLGIPLALGFMGAILVTRMMSSKTKDTLLPRAMQHVGWTYSTHAQQPPFFKRYRKHKMLPMHTSAKFEDRIEGQVGAARFVLTEARLEQWRGKGTAVVFNGLLMDVDFHQPFTSTTIVLRDKGAFNKGKLKNAEPGHLKRVGMASPTWEKMFEAYSTDQVEARVKLDPVFMQRLLDLEQSVDGSHLCFGFFDNRLHVIIATPDRFEAGSVFSPMDDPERMQQLIREIEAIIAVVEGVQATPSSPARP